MMSLHYVLTFRVSINTYQHSPPLPLCGAGAAASSSFFFTSLDNIYICNVYFIALYMLAKDLVNEQSAQQKIALLFVEILECAQRYSEGHCSPQKGFLDKGKTLHFFSPPLTPLTSRSFVPTRFFAAFFAPSPSISSFSFCFFSSYFFFFSSSTTSPFKPTPTTKKNRLNPFFNY